MSHKFTLTKNSSKEEIQKEIDDQLKDIKMSRLYLEQRKAKIVNLSWPENVKLEEECERRELGLIEEEKYMKETIRIFKRKGLI